VRYGAQIPQLGEPPAQGDQPRWATHHAATPTFAAASNRECPDQPASREAESQDDTTHWNTPPADE
jgi:hypothetical protein